VLGGSRIGLELFLLLSANLTAIFIERHGILEREVAGATTFHFILDLP